MSRCGGQRVILVAWAVLAALAAAPARAGGLEDKDLSLRLPAAFSRFATYADVAGVGGASAASPWSSSINPASSAWKPVPGDLHLAFSPQYSALDFSEGTTLHVTSEAVNWDAGEWGTFQPALAQARSNRAQTRQGLDFGLEMDVAQLQWARRAGEDWAFGANANFAASKTRFDFAGLDVSDSRGESYGIRFGALHRPAPNLLAGLVFDYAFSRDRTTLYDFMGLGIGNTRIEDTTHQFLLRPGVSYEYRKDSILYADYQFGAFANDTGRLQVHRFPLGVDHSVTKWLFVRGGVALDTTGHASWTTGVGLYPTERFSIDIAYQSNMFPELAPEFGQSQTITISISITF